MDKETTPEERHFNKVYWFVVGYSALLTAFMAAIVFCRVPKENTQMANMTLSFVFGLLSGVTGVIVITNSDKKQDKTNPPGTSQSKVEITQTDTKTPDNEGATK